MPMPPPKAAIAPPPPAYTASHHGRSALSGSTSTLSSCTDSDSITDSECMIHISPAYYEENPIEGPAVSSMPSGASFAFAASKPPHSRFDDDDDDGPIEFVPTAAFIHSFEHLPDDDDDDDAKLKRTLPEERQRVSAFDFDALPRKPKHIAPKTVGIETHQPHPLLYNPNPHMFIIEPETQSVADSVFSPTGLMQRIQLRCNVNKWLIFTSNGNGDQPEQKPKAHSKAAHGTYSYFYSYCK